MFKCIRNINDCEVLLNCCKEIFAWSENWLMKLNVSKCKILSICHNKNNLIKFDYSFDLPGHGLVTLEYVDSIKDLGVLMDSSLSFDEHVYAKINMANKMLGIIRRTFTDMDKDSFLLLYKGMVRCHLEYAVSVWNPYKKGVIKDLENLQKRATKLIHNCKGLSYKERLIFLQLPTLKFRRCRGDMIEVFKILNSLYDNNVVPALIR